MKMNEVMTMAGNGLTYLLASIQQNEILQIIEFVMSAILTVFILAYRVWHWYREAKKDGKITKDEIDELGSIIEETAKEEKKK